MGIPHDAVWEALGDLESHALWMREVVAIDFETERRRGPGTSMLVKTRIGPFRTLDRIEVTGWREGESIDVEHTGLIKGVGTLSIGPREEKTVVAWDEDLFFPWWLGGPVTAWLARPVLASIWRGNLRRLERLVA